MEVPPFLNTLITRSEPNCQCAFPVLESGTQGQASLFPTKHKLKNKPHCPRNPSSRGFKRDTLPVYLDNTLINYMRRMRFFIQLMLNSIAHSVCGLVSDGMVELPAPWPNGFRTWVKKSLIKALSQ
jgi:hypothetical protein